MIENDRFYEKCAAGIDLIYTPENTMFIKKMNGHGRKCINGLDMLILQGVASFEIWNDIRVSAEAIDAAKEALLKILKERM